MSCTEVTSLLSRLADGRLTDAEHASIESHCRHCADCRDAWLAVRVLRHERLRAIPAPSPDLLDKALRRGAARDAQARPDHRLRRRFLAGAAVGGAVAAGLVVMLLGAAGLLRPSTSALVPELAIALHDVRDVRIAIDSPVDVGAAAIRVVLSGGVALSGFEGRTELRWSSPLDRGTNVLTLPVVMHEPGGGHLLVEVIYGEHRKTFAMRLLEGPARAEA